jgi:flagellar protein FliS
MAFDQRRILVEQVQLATPAERLLMIWERLVLNLGQARDAMGAGEHENANTALISAQQILVILSGTLDHSWEGAASVDALYRWCWEKLVTANVGWDKSALDEAAGVLSQLYDAWCKAAEEVQPALAGS